MVKQIAVFASGSGSNFQAVYDEITKGSINGEISIIITDNADAGILKRAENIKKAVVRKRDFETKDLYEAKLLSLLDNADIIVLAGYLKLLPQKIVSKFENRIINIHPALIPAFCGKGFYGERVHKAVIKSGVKISGLTVHFVDEIFDHGPIIAQKVVGVTFDDTAKTLAKKILEQEHRVFPQVIKLLCEDKLCVINGRVKINE